MRKTSPSHRIIFLNQVAGPLFRELAEDVAKVLGPSLLCTGHPDTLRRPESEGLTILAGPAYDRGSYLRRALSWGGYFLRACVVAGRGSRRALLFMVSNPPFLGLVGLFFKLVRGQRYALLVYDIYPDILISLGIIGNGLLARCWRFVNRLVLERSDLVFTISDDMAARLGSWYDLRRTSAGSAVVIPTWADMESIRPRAKCDNWFAAEHGQVNKITVLYSGNMGHSHDIESILAVAGMLRDTPAIHFLFIGEGAKADLVRAAIRDTEVRNITLLPLQAEEVLPYSLASGDIGIVAYQPGTEGCLVPSKCSYYMAAGLVPLVICSRANDLSRMVEEHSCGMVVANGDREGMAEALRRLARDNALLSAYKQRSRATAERLFSRSNTARYVQVLERFLGVGVGVAEQEKGAQTKW